MRDLSKSYSVYFDKKERQSSVLKFFVFDEFSIKKQFLSIFFTEIRILSDFSLNSFKANLFSLQSVFKAGD